MSHFAVGLKEQRSGRETRTDGNQRHLGQVDTSSLRVFGRGGHPSLSGAGVEILYIEPGGTIQSYNRDVEQYRDLNISARNITLTPNAPGTLVLPAGSVGTAALAPNAVMAHLGEYVAGVSWSTTVVGTWLATSILVNIISGGGRLRIEWSTGFGHPVAGAIGYCGVGWDGAVVIVSTMWTMPSPNAVLPVSGVCYATLPAGAHSVQLFAHNSTAGTLAIPPNMNSMLFVTEEKQ